MDPKTLVILSSKCRKQVSFDELCVAVDLPVTYRFSERTYVRLHSAAGFKEPVHLFISFVEQVPFGETFRRHLALVAPGTLPGPWTRLDGSFVNNLSNLRVVRADGKPFTSVPREDFSLLIEFDAEHGGPGGYSGYR